MKSYPSIDKHIRKDIPILAFSKIDGSNIRAEWNNKRGFYKFGTRTELIDERSKPFGITIPMIKDLFEKDLSRIFNDQKWDRTIVFFELFGESSFAGTHDFSKPLNLSIIDVNPYKKGILPPEEFVHLFSHLNIAPVLYSGYIDEKLFDQVKQGTLPGMSLEGVVCKGMDDDRLIMFKIKSTAWLNKLRNFCGDNEALFNKLS